MVTSKLFLNFACDDLGVHFVGDSALRISFGVSAVCLSCHLSQGDHSTQAAWTMCAMETLQLIISYLVLWDFSSLHKVLPSAELSGHCQAGVWTLSASSGPVFLWRNLSFSVLTLSSRALGPDTTTLASQYVCANASCAC